MDHLITKSLGVLALAGAIGGCSSMPSFLGGSSRTVSFNNVSDTPVNVTFYVTAAMPPAGWNGDPMNWDNTDSFMIDGHFQVERGTTAKYRVSRSGPNGTNPAVHVKVEPVSPSWESTATEYWLEILTNPPVSIVATGKGNSMTFNTGQGAIAVIPEDEIDSGRFDHRVVSVPNNEMD